MAKKPQVEAEVLTGLRVNVSQAELDACLKAHLDLLVHVIRSPQPAEGGLPALIAAIDILKTQIIPRDDKAGRGLVVPDVEETA